MSNFGRHIALSGIDWLAHDEDANTAYLFECDDEGLFAISSQRDGRNIPIGLCAEGWQLKQAFLLGAREAVPFDLHPETILRSLEAKDYYIWRVGSNLLASSQ